MSASESRSGVVLQLAEEFLERYRQGQRPSLKEYIDRHPELADEIKEVFPAMALMENIALADEDMASRGCQCPASAPPQQLGDFRILREVGRGGMGIVYEAEQVSLGRHVALKVLPRTLFVEDQQRRRFEREAKAAAKLHHTNIVPVFGVGEHDGMPYYVMQFIQGLGLDDVLEELKRMQGSGKPIPQTLSTRGRRGQEENGELSMPPRDVSVEDIARSLLTGEFQGAMRPEESAEPRTIAPDAIAPEVNGPGSPERSRSGTPSDSLGPSLSLSSVKLPISGGVSFSKGKKASYWQSVAQVGVQVAEALEYAHKQGIQHRDIKPSNLLLDTRGTVWVTDFGLARADNEDHLTNTGDIVGTLRYMPPEAFEGRADKRGDIYSLGLTLYELLALKPAYEERDRHQLIKRVTTEEPVRLDKLNPAIPRDLVTIVHKAIDQEPGRRYASAAELAADLQRFLDDEPIQARRISQVERLARWCRHHPGVAALTATLALILLAVTVASLFTASRLNRLARDQAAMAESERQARRAADDAKEQESALRKQAQEAQRQAESNLQEAERQRRRAEANFATARKAVDDYFTTVSQSQLLLAPGTQPLRRELLQSALNFYQRFLRERGKDPELRGELAATYLRVGWLRVEMSEGDEARQAFEQARRLYEELTKASPKSVEWQHGLAQCYRQLSRNDEAIALWQKLVRPGEPHFQRELADAYNHRALTCQNVGKHDEAMQAHQKALAIREVLVRLSPNNPDAQRDLSGTLNNIGVLLGEKGQNAEALAMYRRAANHAEIAFARASQVILNGRFLAASQNNIAVMEQKAGHAKEALTAYQRAVEVWRKLARDNPAVLSLQSDLFKAYRLLALSQRELKQTEEAERTMRLAHETIDRLPSDGPEALFNLACIRAECATFFGQGKYESTAEARAEQQRQADQAMETLRKALAAGFHDVERLRKAGELNALRSREDFKLLEADLAARVAVSPLDKLHASQQVLALRQKQAQADLKDKRLQADLAASLHAIALIHLDLGKWDEARKLFNQAATLREALAKDQPKNAQYQTEWTASRLYLDLARARQLVEQKRDKEAETALAQIENFPSSDAKAYKERGRIYFALNQPDKSAADFRKAVELLDEKALDALVLPIEPARSEADKSFVQLADEALLSRLTAAVGSNSEDLDHRWKRGQWYARHRRWKEAGADFKMALERNIPPNDYIYMQAAAGLAAGDHEGYHHLCREMLKRFRETQEPTTAERIAKVSLLLPPSTNETMEQASELADRAVARGKNHPLEFYFIFCKGLADYRRSNWRTAFDGLDALAPRIPPDRPEMTTCCHLVLAMALHRQGQAKAAHKHLAQAAKLLDRYLPDPTRFPAFGPSHYQHDWLIALLLHREAQTLIEGKIAESKN